MRKTYCKTHARGKRQARGIRKKRLPRHHAIAVREAGHAVVAWESGVMLMPLSIFAVAKGAGRNVWNNPLRNVDFDWVRTAESPALARRLASILIAGPVAERVLGPKLPRCSAYAGRLRDARALLDASARPSAGHSKKHFERAVADSEKFLERPRVKQAVKALAAVLLNRGTIRGGEAASIIEAHFDV
jgi:hypothetical protein